MQGNDYRENKKTIWRIDRIWRDHEVKCLLQVCPSSILAYSDTSTQPEVLRQIGIRLIICVVAMWLQALDKTLSMRPDKLSAWHFPNTYTDTAPHSMMSHCLLWHITLQPLFLYSFLSCIWMAGASVLRIFPIFSPTHDQNVPDERFCGQSCLPLYLSWWRTVSSYLFSRYFCRGWLAK